MTTEYKSKLTLLVIALSLSVNLSAATAAGPGAATAATPTPPSSTELSSGIASYNRADYAAAVLHLTRAVNDEPINATARYYLACTYQRTGKIVDAIAEYKLAQSFDRQGVIAKYATTALSGYTVSGATNNSVVSSPVQKAVDQITRQAQIDQSLIQQKSAAHAAASQATGNYEEQQLAQTRDTTVRRMQNSYWTDKDGNSYPVYTQGQIQAVKSDYDQRISSVDQLMKDDMQKHLSFGSQTSAALKESVTGLQSLLQSATAGRHAAQLLPDGTNLFVRNYATFASASSAPEPELKASQQQLILTAHNHDKKDDWHVVPVAESADEDKLLLQAKQKGTELKVHGEMVPRVKAQNAASP